MTIVRTVELDGEDGASGAIGVGAADEMGNWPMVVTTRASTTSPTATTTP